MTDVTTLPQATASQLAGGFIYLWVPGAPATQLIFPAESLISSGVREAAGTTDTLVLDDTNGTVRCTNAAAVTVTVPPNADVAFPIGSFVEIIQDGTGVVTVSPGSGVTIDSRGSLTGSAGQYAVLGIRKVATNRWILTGDLG